MKQKFRHYIANCFDVPKNKRNQYLCLMERLKIAWRDPKYDVDILLLFVHVIWALSIYFGSVYPEYFYSPTSETIIKTGGKWPWIISALALSTLHYLSIFTRKPIIRIIVFSMSVVWGLGISLTISNALGLNTASFMYAMIFVYMPLRKIRFILEDSFFHYQIEIEEKRKGNRGE